MVTAVSGRPALALLAVSIAVTLACASEPGGAAIVADCIREASSSGLRTFECPVSAEPFAVVLLPKDVSEAEWAASGVTVAERDRIAAAQPTSYASAVAVFTPSGWSTAWYLGSFVGVERLMRVQRDVGGTIQVTVKSQYPLPVVASLK